MATTTVQKASNKLDLDKNTDEKINVSCHYIINEDNITIYLGKDIYQLKNPAKSFIANLITLINEFSKTKSKDTYQNIINQLSPISRAGIVLGKDFTYDSTNKKVYYKGSEVPKEITIKLLELSEKQIPVDYLTNFCTRLFQNPDERARKDLFKFLSNNGHPITPEGLFIGYKKVVLVKNKSDLEILEDSSEKEEVKESHLNSNVLKSLIDAHKEKRKKSKKSTINDLIYFNKKSGLFIISNKEDLDKKVFKYIGDFNSVDKKLESKKIPKFLQDILNTIQESEKTEVKEIKKTIKNKVFTDSHTRTMRIELFTEVTKDRNSCDPNPNQSCSSGLHIGSMGYVGGFTGDTILICLIDPKDVVAVPVNYNSQKMRVCKYIPIAIYDKEFVTHHISANEIFKL